MKKIACILPGRNIIFMKKSLQNRDPKDQGAYCIVSGMSFPDSSIRGCNFLIL